MQKAGEEGRGRNTQTKPPAVIVGASGKPANDMEFPPDELKLEVDSFVCGCWNRAMSEFSPRGFPCGDN